MKTPEDIKTGLRCLHCAECPYDEHNYDDKESRCGNVERDALAYILQLETQNAELVRKADELAAQVPKWISVEERKPKNGQLVLTVDSIGIYEVLRYYEVKDAFGSCGGLLYVHNVTHWMPLPDTEEINNDQAFMQAYTEQT